MKKLYNKVDRKVLKDQLNESHEARVTLSFYKYWNIKNPLFFRDYLFIHWEELGVFGRTYIAKEGINAQISVPENHFEEFVKDLYSVTFLDGVRLNIAVDDDGKSFYKLKIKLRHKIVADGLNDDTFDPTNRGVHLSAKAFNELTDDPETIIVDMRNHYESEVGHFQNAILPDADNFRDELPMVKEILKGKEDKNIVMYCTGGIRCEKASAWFKHEGFPNVHQLDGGIIEYARQAEREGLPNKFRGKNFVFDERLGERISNEIIAQCHVCGEPCDDHTNCANLACHILFIQCEACKTKYQGCCSQDCTDVVHLPEEEQQALRKGHVKDGRHFKKGRAPQLKFKKDNTSEVKS